MKFFIDTANIEEIKAAAALGVLDGVTTNPSLIAKEKGKFEEIIKEICAVVEGPVSAEAVSTDHDAIISEAEALVKIASNVVVKIPCILEGLKATKTLKGMGIGVNMTLVFSPMQALLAAKAGAQFVSPFIGRLDDIAHDGMDLIEQIVNIYNNYAFDTEILVASVRHPIHVVESALLGADVVTMPYGVIKKLAQHPLTDIGLEKFLADWEKVKNR